MHPDTDLQDPLPHPALRAHVPRPAHVYRLENAVGVLETTMSTVDVLPRRPRPGRGVSFAQSISSWTRFAEELKALRTDAMNGEEASR